MKRKVYEWQICFIFMYLLILTICNSKLLKCIEGNSVSFECPCSEEFSDCRFKKLFQGGYIARDGMLSVDHRHYHRYEFNDIKTVITLKECNEDDEGTYVWMCGRSNVNTHYDLEVQKVSGKILLCFVGGKVSFECPCCAEELNSCKFKKIGQHGYIARSGVLSHQFGKYELNDKKTHITLIECHRDDEGTYVWMCGRCNVNKQFQLLVPKLSKYMKCPVGGEVSFECPCPQELDSCRFEKLEEESQIVLYNVFNIHKRYALNEHKTHITLKECNEDDEGTYVWMCGRCNVNKQFHLEIQAFEVQGHNQDATRSKTAHLHSNLMPFLFQFCFVVWFVSSCFNGNL